MKNAIFFQYCYVGRKPNYKNQDFIRCVSSKIVEFAKKKGLAQEQIAEMLEMDEYRQIGRVLRGESNFGISELARFADILEVHPKDFFEFEWPRNKKA